jgi:aldose 1-epimerase
MELSEGALVGIKRRSVGVTDGHSGQIPTEVHAYSLDSGGLSVVVWSYGASLVEVRVPDRAGHRENVVVRLPHLRAYENPSPNAYVGATVGRYCRCVSDGTFTLDGVRHELDRNDGRHHVHGGSLGFDRFVWDADAETTRDALVVRCRLVSPDGDQGYPGTVTAEARYELSEDGRLSFAFEATTTASTVVGLTNHAFWNLAGPGETIDGHRLSLNSGRVVPFGDELIPLPGPPRGVGGTALDHRESSGLAGRRLDHFFVLDDPGWAAELVHEPSGRIMRVRTDQSGMGVYTGDSYRPARAGLCLESGPWPDAPNRPDFPSVRLDPGQTYRHRTTHEFSLLPGGAVPGRGTTAEGWEWETATSATEVHDLLTSCDAHQAARSGTRAPVRRLEVTEQLVRDGAVRVLRHGARPVAMFTLTSGPGKHPPADCPAAGRPAYLSRLAVAPELLTVGSLVGVRCVRKAIGTAAATGADVLRAEANPDLRETRALLDRLGFVQHGPVYVTGTGRRYVQLEKVLRPPANGGGG